ncbi:hypothetical protein VPH35_103487 [Triticum aestivum]
MDKLLMLDIRRMKFSTVNDRTGYHMHLRCLLGQADEVVARNNMPSRHWPGHTRTIEMFSLVGEHIPNSSFGLYHTTQQNNSESQKEWQLENIIQLPGHYHYFTLGAVEGFLFLGATTKDQLDIEEDSPVWLSRTDWDVDYFSLDVKTYELVKVCRRKKELLDYEDVYWYFVKVRYID